MRPLPASGAGRDNLLVGSAILGCLALVLLTPALVAAPAILLLATAVVFRTRVASPAGLVAILVGTIMWIPAGRYSVVGAPAALPWRLVVLVVLLAIFLALALDRRVRWQPAPFLQVVIALPAAALLSSLANLWNLAELRRVEAGALASLQLFLLIGIFIAARQMITSPGMAEWSCRLLVLAGGVVAVAVGWEYLSGFNVFINLHRFLPLQLLSDAPVVTRFGAVRALGSANHPIALSVVLVMLLPGAVFLAHHAGWPHNPGAKRFLYLGIAFAMVLAAFLTGSRTFVVMLAAIALLLLLSNWVLFVRALFLAVPLAVLAAVLLPGKVPGLIQSLLDPEKLLESQRTSAGGRGSGRLADLGPSLAEAKEDLLFGTGVGSRVVSGDEVNALILDNQYLTTLLESGLVGLTAMVVLLVTPVVVMLRRRRDARLDRAERDLALALACVFASYAVAAFFFDAFGFQQTLMVFLLLLAVASWLTASAVGRRSGRAASADGANVRGTGGWRAPDLGR